MKKTVLFVILSFFLSSCYAYVDSNVQSYSKIKTNDYRKSIAILPTNKEMINSLEFEEFSYKVAAQLRYKNFNVINDPAKAELIALVNYGIDTGQNVTSTVTLPTYGQTGYSGSSTFGSLNTYGNYGTFSGTTTYYPSYGITGYQNYTSNRTVYTRVFQLDIYEAFKTLDDNPNKIYEAKVVSRGRCSSISSVIDEILASLFRDFPNSFSGSITESSDGVC